MLTGLRCFQIIGGGVVEPAKTVPTLAEARTLPPRSLLGPTLWRLQQADHRFPINLFRDGLPPRAG